ncbi:MAG TPA: amidohydrolase family protein [Casimicrobiaceae bacterium]|nr:amidohydrolase family protein [Casimicrobiaceae bacterium]
MTPRVDAHHHVWTVARGDYGWLRPTRELAPICRDFSLADLRPLLAAANIEATVLVQAAPSVAETEFLLHVARESGGLVRGVVGWVDLDAADAIATLERLAREPLLRSVRPMLQDLADAQWILRPGVQAALRALPDLGLRFDALVKPRELDALLRTLERHPDLAVVVDHCAKPDIAAGVWQPWADDLAAIARHTRAHCKLSGLVTEAGADWTVERLRRYVDQVLGCFGPDRVLWGSDWPVVTLAASYARWSSASDALLEGLAAAEQQAIRGGNARRFYGLG